MNTYIVTLLPYGDKMLPYKITVTSDTSDDAIIRAKRFVAETGYWPRHLNIEEIMEVSGIGEKKFASIKDYITVSETED